MSAACCPKHIIIKQVAECLNEDLSLAIDYTSSLVPLNQTVTAIIRTNQEMLMCGREWVNQTFYLCDAGITIKWFYGDGDLVNANEVICRISGNAAAILSAERTALNFLQTLSATATITNKYVAKVAHTGIKILDTRKTIPGLRLAQKYAVTIGGGYNQRVGLYDGVLIKENHIASCGGVKMALRLAFDLIPKHIPIQIEVETVEQFKVAVDNEAKMILLDNMSIEDIKQCVAYNKDCHDKVLIEISGNITLDNIGNYISLGIHRISIGSLTKNIQAIDLSMRII